MKLSNEEIAKVYHLYANQLYLQCYNIEQRPVYEILTGSLIDDIEPDFENKRDLLLLTPLSEITDEHAVGVAEIVSDYWDKTLLTEKIFHGKRYAQRALFIPDGEAQEASLQLTIHGIYIYQYLISHGYAVPLFFAPNHWANGKTPLDLGIAISKNEVK